MEFVHRPVLAQEAITALNIRPDRYYVDGTAGGGGHSSLIASRLTTGRLYSFDRDPDAVFAASEKLKGLPATVIHANFDEMQERLLQEGIGEIDGVLLDLGVSSFQLDTPSRGFSYQHEGLLDMRMSKTGQTAADIVNHETPQELIRILHEYGEERFASLIVRQIVRERSIEPITTTSRLAEIVTSSLPAKARRGKNPCKRTFQALRIAVNGELDSLSEGLDVAFSLLRPGGRLCVITFHSLEDRMVKQRFQTWSRGCICPPDCPVCICGRTPEAKIIAKKPIIASEQELAENMRSRSAKLRVIEKIK